MRPDRVDAIREMLIAHVRAEPERQAARRRRRRWLAGAAGVVAVGAGVTAGAIVLSPVTLTELRYVTCLESDQPSALDETASAAALNGGEFDGVQDAIDMCALMWESGIFGPDYDPLAVDNPPGRMPDVVQVCVMSDGSAAVVPSDEPAVCTRLGLAPLGEGDGADQSGGAG